MVRPIVPFRVMTEEERDEIRDYFRKDPKSNNREFWKQPREEARKVVKAIKHGGFVVGGEINVGSPESEGALTHVYSKRYSQGSLTDSCDYKRVIGSVSMWEAWGFVFNPVSVWYQNPTLLTDSIELRKYLIDSGISFRDNVDVKHLRDEISRLEGERDNKSKILEVVMGLDLRK